MFCYAAGWSVFGGVVGSRAGEGVCIRAKVSRWEETKAEIEKGWPGTSTMSCATYTKSKKTRRKYMRWKRRRASWMPVGFWKVGPVGREDLDKVKFDSKNEREKLDGKNIEYKLIEIGWIGSRWVERMWTKVLFWRRSLISLTRIGLTEVEEVRLIEVSLPTGKFDRGI